MNESNRWEAFYWIRSKFIIEAFFFNVNVLNLYLKITLANLKMVWQKFFAVLCYHCNRVEEVK